MTAAILLAAGRSTRMGTQKLLLPVHGMPLLAKVAAAFPPDLVDGLFVVVRPEAHELREAVRAPHVQWVVNPEPDADMLSSVRCGLRALPEGVETVLVTPADMPGLEARLMAALLKAWADCLRSILVPVHEGRRGHPLVFSARHIGQILRDFDGVGLRGLLMARAEEVFEWPAATPVVLQDWDTPADLR